jgi:hypothetical protein
MARQSTLGRDRRGHTVALRQALAFQLEQPLWTLGKEGQLLTCEPAPSVRKGLVVQHDTQESIVNLEAAVVVDEAEFPKLVHEKVHT